MSPRRLALAAALTGLLVGAPAQAARPPPDYRESLVKGAAAQAEALNAEGRYDDAIDLGRRFQRAVEPAAPVAYEVGYALNRKGDIDAAIRAYSEAIDLDPSLATARYDRGELLMLKGRVAEARQDFEAALKSRPDHWAVHFRLADLAGRDGDPQGLETHLMEALRNGMDPHTLLDDPHWRDWFADPTLGPVLRRVVLLYGDRSLLEGL